MTQHRPVYHYEVELKIVNPNTTEMKLVTREEHAYSPFDAWMQALMAISSDAGSAEIKVVHVRPVAAAIAASQAGMDKAIMESVYRLGAAAVLGLKGDKVGKK